MVIHVTLREQLATLIPELLKFLFKIILKENIKNSNILINEPQEFVPEVLISEVKKEIILKGLGMQLSDADDYLQGLIEELTFSSYKLLSPKTSFKIYDDIEIITSNYKIRISDTVFDTSKVVALFLKKSDYIAVFACTCGDAVEQYSKDLMKNGNTLEGLIVDIIGSEMAEIITEKLHNFIESIANKNGMSVSNRYSPGYCKWDVSEQQKLFPLLKDRTCGIQLMPSSLMLPVKSVSGILGIGHSIKRLPYKCSLCDDKNCIMREA